MPNIALISLYGAENNGIRSISSVLTKEGLNVYLIFFKRWLNNDIRLPTENEKKILISLLKELNVGIVGISFTSPFFKITKDIAVRIKRDLPAKVILGGIHATVNPGECLEYCDIVCRGEGEYAMVDLVKACMHEYDFEGIKNICYKEDGRIILNQMRPLIQDLDGLPYQDYGGTNKFFIDGKLYNMDPLSNARELRILASRGCPFNCSYCYNSIFRKLYTEKKYYRIKSVESIISEVEHALGNFKNIRKIKFDDDTFLFPKDWIKEFCRKYKGRIGLPFEILYNAECLDEGVLGDLKDAGLKGIQLGIQIGSKRKSEEIFNRSLPVENIRHFAGMSKNLKIDVVYDVILDNPMAGLEDKKELVDFLLTLPRPFNLFIYSLTIFPGTELCELFLKRGLIRPEEVEGRANKSFYQFRLSFSYPRSREELFFACIISLTSKTFLPKSLISLIMGNDFLRKHPLPLKWFAEFCNMTKLSYVLIKMFIQGDLSIWKFKEYGLPRRFLIQ